MKRILSFLLALTLVFSMLPNVFVQAASIDGYFFEVEDGEAIITGYTGTDSEITLPTTLNGYPVRAIGFQAFAENSTLTSVTIPEGIMSFYAEPFRDCVNLKEVSIAGTVKEINSMSFYGCANLETVILEEGIEKIGYYAFAYCTNLKNITLPQSLTSIGDQAFEYCSGLTSVIIPAGVTEIGDWPFRNCSSMLEISVDDDNANYCDVQGALLSKDRTKLYRVPGGLTGDYTIPDGVTEIVEHALQYNLLTSVTIPAGVTTIGDYAMTDSDNLTSVIIDKDVTTIGASVFSQSFQLKDIYYTGTQAQWEQISIGEDNDELNEITIHYEYTGEPLEYTYSLNNGEAIITGYTGTGTAAVIPATLGGASVTAIGAEAFKDCADLTSVTIPYTVTAVGSDAFSNCSNLMQVHIADIAAWCNIAFASAGANPLRYGGTLYVNGVHWADVLIPAGVTAIGAYAFCGSGLTSITLPEGVLTIGNRAFYNCDSLTSVTLPEGLTTVDAYAFYDCSNLATITIPVSVTTIGNRAFRYCSSLSDVHYGGTEEQWNAISVGSDNECLTGATIHFATEPEAPDAADYTYTVENGEATITGYTGAGGDITIPSKLGGYPVTAIGDKAFYSNDTLTSVIIPNGITSIGMQAFIYCSKLTSVTIPGSITTFGTSAFYYCSGLTSVTIQDGATIIGAGAFYSCDKLASITIPASVTTIGDFALESCESLTGIWVDENNANYSSDDKGVLFDKNKTMLIQAPGGLSGEYTIPDSVVTINESAFSHCNNLTAVVIPDSVTTIGNSAFHSSNGLTSVTIPGSVKTIGKQAFFDCNGLTDVTLENGVTTIGEEVFQYCENLTTVTIPASVTSIGWQAFVDCDSLSDVYYTGSEEQWSEITIGSGNSCLTDANIHFVDDPENPDYTYSVENDEATILGYAGTGGDITIPSTLGGYPVTAIGDEAFSGNYLITGVVIPNGVTTIGYEAFYSCELMTSVSIPDSVTTIGGRAFRWCTGLLSVNIPASVTTIGESAFAVCNKLDGIWVDAENPNYCSDDKGVLFNKEKTTLMQAPGMISGSYSVPDSVTAVCGDAFRNCTGVTDVTIGNSVATIGSFAFTDCTCLTSVTIPVSLTTIGDAAFDGCTALTDVYYGGTEQQWHAIGFGSYNDTLHSGTVHFAEHTHSYEAVVTAPTCTEGGYTTYTCSCDDSYTADETDPLGHDYKSAYIKPTYKADGYTSYTCSRCGDTYTEVDEGTMLKAPVVSKQPVGAGVVYPNTWITLSVEAEGGEGELTYRWQKRRVEDGAKWTWTNSYGATAEFKTSKWTHYEYRCRIIDENNKYVYSDAAGWVKKDSILTITEEPVFVKGVKKGESVTFTVAAESDCEISYQWYRKNKGKDTFTATSIKTASFMVTAQTYAEHEYYCVVTDEYGGRKQSKTVSFRTRTKDFVVTDPTDTAISAYGDMVTFSVEATGQGAITYQWQKSKNGGASWFNATGATSATYTFKGVEATHMSNGTQILYRCVVTDEIGIPYTTKAVTFNVG